MDWDFRAILAIQALDSADIVVIPAREPADFPDFQQQAQAQADLVAFLAKADTQEQAKAGFQALAALGTAATQGTAVQEQAVSAGTPANPDTQGTVH